MAAKLQPEEKQYILLALKNLEAFYRRQAARDGQLQFAVDGFKKEADLVRLLALKMGDTTVSLG